MQTEEVVPRTQSTGIDGSLTDSSSYQSTLNLSPHPQCSLPATVHMAVKQEPQDDDERDVNSHRSSSNEALNSQQAEPSAAPIPAEGTHHHHPHEPVHQQVHQQTGANLERSSQDGIKSKTSRGRRKSRWKLKFHHQALPPEYLDHYEAALAQESLNTSPTHGIEPAAPSPAPTTSTSTSTSTPSPVSDVQGWLQRIAAIKQELYPRVTCLNPTADSNLQSNLRRSVITSTSHVYSGNNHQHYPNHHHHNNHHQPQQIPQQPAPRPPMKYSDLPYMGEITLDNSKPRRGRKPKKADICHLIYKNYGTILPGTPGHEDRKQLPKESCDSNRELTPQVSLQRTDIQNRISSLLEKRLTQESKRLTFSEELREQDEPLNLCIKDLNQLKIRLSRKYGNVYESGQVKSETSSDGEDVECLGNNLSKTDSIRPIELLNNINNNNNNQNILNNNTKNINNNDATNSNSGFVYWPNASVFIHPVALQSQFLYYQKMANSDKNLPAIENSPKEQKIVPKSAFNTSEVKNSNANPIIIPPTNTAQPVSPRPKRIAPLGHPPSQPTKRKRSAIFIPPMPTENTNNPATEVSICKFKFTGGAKPSLQEKKSLSVDSGGNFRYYSGTGDKSMRGYEFFPRESLQQPAGQAGSSAGAFLSAAGERIPPPQCQRIANQDEGRKKRKTRKSLQREKLEQTFKEKGFLIQTQQLESAEGATYCKFRQLRKFTRYLFRSWKDYLPGNVRDLTGNADGVESLDAEVERDHSTSPLPLPGIVDMQDNVLEEHRTLPLT
ncbi:uncharacterized protein [Chelonus insularis]|nr:uncharacterized protein LOC118066065 isoform X2 [Chelonus insularis]